MRRTHRVPLAALSAAVFMLVAGCGGTDAGQDKDKDADTGDSNALPPVESCPAAPATAATFPSGTSAQLPHPAYATDIETESGVPKGVDLIRFTTPMSLGAAAKFVIDAYPKAGYRIIQGDSELHEADIPFVKGDIKGKLRLSGTADCSTTWLLATVDGTATDLDAVPGLGDDHDGDSDSGDSDHDSDSGDSDSDGDSGN